MSPTRLLFLALLGACTGAPAEHPVPGVPVRCGVARAEAWAPQANLTGLVTARPDRDAVVASQEPGRLVQVAVELGEHVTAGQVLAEVEPLPQQDAADQAQAQVQAARASRDEAKIAADRAHQLEALGTGSAATAEAADAHLAGAESALRSARAALTTASEHLRRTQVRAPVEGVVVRLIGRSGELVDGTPSTPLVEIADPRSLELTATVGAHTLAQLAVGQRASVRLGELEPVEGTIIAVSPGLDPTSGLGVVRLELHTATPVPFGTTGRAEITLGEPRPVVVVPQRAIRAAGSGAEVVRCEGDVAEVIGVEVVDRRGDRVAVQGIPADANIVLEGIVGLESGVILEPVR